MLFYLQIALSIFSIIPTLFYNASKPKMTFIGNIITLSNQILWFIYAMISKQYGLLPISLVFFSVSYYKICEYILKSYTGLDRVNIKMTMFTFTGFIIALICNVGYIIYRAGD